jgi:Transposase DDE domain group 1
MLAMRDAIPEAHGLAKAEFVTIRLRLIKIGARIAENAARVRVAFSATCPEAKLFTSLVASLTPNSS